MAHIYITPEEYAEAEKNGICRETLDRRIRTYGWDRQKAITTKVRERKTSNLKAWFDKASANGIGKNTFLKRVYVQKWSHEDAATKPIDVRFSRTLRAKA